MGIKINFDTSGNLEELTLVLAYRNGDKISTFSKIHTLSFKESVGNPSEFSFRVYKNEFIFWDKIKDFRLIWVQEWDRWFEIYVELNESNSNSKFITAKHLPETELANLKLYNTEINTEDDINREDYDKPTIFFDEQNPESSLLHRITEKAVNFTFKHIDKSLVDIQRTFTFDDEYIYDAFKDIEEEVNCIFEFDSSTDENGNIVRSISAYDLESYCYTCGYRGEFSNECPECGSTNISNGYGEDTTIFLSLDNVLEEVNYTIDTGSVKNCFKLEAGDDLMTAAVISCNPNGSSYIWNISDSDKEDMSDELVSKIDSYIALYSEYNKTHNYDVSTDSYNNLITKYKKYNGELEELPSSIVGFSNLMTAYFDVIDMQLYLESELMPTPETSGTNATEQGELILKNVTSVSVSNTYISNTTADNAVLGMAKAVADSRYQIEISDGSYVSNNTWVGSFIITNYSDEDDTYTTASVSITIDNNYEEFIKQKIEKVLAKGDDEDYGITGLFSYDLDVFKEKIKEYALSPLEQLMDCCQSAIDILIEQGVANSDSDLYSSIYIPYLNKLNALQDEIALRENEISIVDILLDDIDNIRTNVQAILDFENYVGEGLWKELSAFRREDTFSNSNYVSDGLSNSELFRNANEFLETANKELVKSSTLQRSITGTLKNIFTIKEFSPLKEHFSKGNWLRIGVNDGIYKLRLLEYIIDFEDYTSSEVTFSDVEVVQNDISDIRSVIENAYSISSSYSYVQRQATQGSQTYTVMDGWTKEGLDATAVKIVNNADNQDIVYDSHGLLFREYNDITDAYNDTQLKIINSTIAITDDNWKSVRTAIGRFYYTDPSTGVLTEAYGINGEVICGQLIIGEELGIYNSSNSLSFDSSGLTVSNSLNTVSINPNSNTLFTVSKNGTNILYLDASGNLNLTGKITASSGSIGGFTIDSSCLYNTNSSGNYVYLGNGTNSNQDVLVVRTGTSSSGYSYPFYVRANGYLYASNATISGAITATTLTATSSGTIACWTINSSSIYRSSATYGASGGMYFGTSGLSISSTFKVSSGGALTCTGATITGSITATSISIKDAIYVYGDNISNTRVLRLYTETAGTVDGELGLALGETCGFIYLSDFIIITSPKSSQSGTEKQVTINSGLWANSVGTDEAHVYDSIYMAEDAIRAFTESSGNYRTILRPEETGGAYLGSSNYRWHSVYCTDGAWNGSDKKIKDHIEYLSETQNLEDFYMGLKPAIYTLKNGEGKRHHMGLYAQDASATAMATVGDLAFYQAIVESVDDDGEIIENYYDPNVPDEKLSWVINYNELVAPTITMVQNNRLKITELENKIAQLERELETLQSA